MPVVRRVRTATFSTFIIDATLTGSAITGKTYVVRAINRTTREYADVQVDSVNRAAINIDDLSGNGLGGGVKSGFVEGDVIELSVSGYGYSAISTVTATKTSPGASVNLSVVNYSDTDSTFNQGALQTSLGTGDNNSSITLTQGLAGQKVKKFLILAPGATGNITLVLYNGSSQVNPVSGTLYLAAQPPDGFEINRTVSTGIIGWTLAGRTGGGTTAYVNVEYEI